MYLLDTYKLTKLPEFKFISVINLFNLVATTHNRAICGYAIHAIGTLCESKQFLSQREIKKTFNLGDKLEHIFPICREIVLNYLDNIPDDIFYSMDYWLDESTFYKRLESYMKNLNTYKELNILT
jgi:hypothetical protein